MAQSNTSRWETPKFSFNSEDQAAAWREFYTRALDYLETLDTDPEVEDEHKKRWKQMKMMFTGEDRQALQTLIDNNTITPEDQHTPIHQDHHISKPYLPVYKDTKHVPVIRNSHPKQPKKLQTSNNTAVPSNQTTAKQPAQESPQANTHSQQTRKSPVLPMPPASTRQTVISGPPQCNSNRYQHNPYFPRPQNVPISQRQ